MFKRNRNVFDADPGFTIFGIIFAMFFIIFFGILAIGGIFTYKCYTSNDPNSMACYMISDKNEIGIRQR